MSCESCKYLKKEGLECGDCDKPYVVIKKGRDTKHILRAISIILESEKSAGGSCFSNNLYRLGIKLRRQNEYNS